MAIDLWRTRPFLSSSMRGAVDRLFEEAFAPFYSGRDSGTNGSGQTGLQSLPVTIWETDDAFHAALMAPGLDENSIAVTVQEDTLSIEGELKFQPPEGARLIWQEFGPMHFRRSLRFGTSIDASRVEAVYRNGLLMINMPKAEEARPRQVRVQVGDGSRSMDGGGSEQAAMTGQSQMTADQQQAQHDRMEQQNQQ
ncbi:MAG TPA: Hsp20/alpha crystallin family protein [Chloroflexota bacterium]|nr:Hsp20/alpha crystallin family protein [Chloroflexota bacterium]